MILLALICFGLAGGATACARMTREDRSYYPMQKVIWSAFGFTFGGSGVANLLGERGQHGELRLVFLLALLLAVGYSIFFIYRRNRVARYIPLRMDGQPDFVDSEALRLKSELVTSVVYHGDAPEAWVEGLEEACAHWRQVQRFRAEARQRNARRRGIE